MDSRRYVVRSGLGSHWIFEDLNMALDCFMYLSRFNPFNVTVRIVRIDENNEIYERRRLSCLLKE